MKILAETTFQMRMRTKRPPPPPPSPRSKNGRRRPRGAIEVIVVTDKDADLVVVHFAGHVLSRIAIRGRSASLAFAEVIRLHALELPNDGDDDDD